MSPETNESEASNINPVTSTAVGNRGTSPVAKSKNPGARQRIGRIGDSSGLSGGGRSAYAPYDKQLLHGLWPLTPSCGPGCHGREQGVPWFLLPGEAAGKRAQFDMLPCCIAHTARV